MVSNSSRRTRRQRASLLGAVAAVFVLLLGALPAAASNGGGAVSGQGTIAPGLSGVHSLGDGDPQSVSFDGNGVAVFANPSASISISCHFSGSSTIDEGLDAGYGTVNGGCSGDDLISGGTISTTCNGLIYTRVAAEVVVNGQCTGGVSGSVVAECAFVADPGLPVVSYRLVCVFVISDASTSPLVQSIIEFIDCILHTAPVGWIDCVI